MYQRVSHVCITVKDLDRVLGWFKDTFGLTNLWVPYEYRGELSDTFTGFSGTHFRVGKVQLGDFVLEFIQYLSPKGGEIKGDLNVVGYPHIGFVVDDIEEAYNTLKERGVKFRSAPAKITDTSHPMCGYSLVFLWGPENITIELIEAPKD